MTPDPCEACFAQGVIIEDMNDGRQIVKICDSCHGTGEINL